MEQTPIRMVPDETVTMLTPEEIADRKRRLEESAARTAGQVMIARAVKKVAAIRPMRAERPSHHAMTLALGPGGLLTAEERKALYGE